MGQRVGRPCFSPLLRSCFIILSSSLYRWGKTDCYTGINVILKFLSEYYSKGFQCRSLGMVRSAVSTFLKICGNMSINQYNELSRFSGTVSLTQIHYYMVSRYCNDFQSRSVTCIMRWYNVQGVRVDALCKLENPVVCDTGKSSLYK